MQPTVLVDFGSHADVESFSLYSAETVAVNTMDGAPAGDGAGAGAGAVAAAARFAACTPRAQKQSRVHTNVANQWVAARLRHTDRNSTRATLRRIVTTQRAVKGGPDGPAPPPP